jgi:hypothetical protein
MIMFLNLFTFVYNSPSPEPLYFFLFLALRVYSKQNKAVNLRTVIVTADIHQGL